MLLSTNRAFVIVCDTGEASILHLASAWKVMAKEGLTFELR